ncbi:glycosyltransferase [Ketobacter sp.]|uniref:glycosyltransferase n=1 Tax=Ketobacter sp. TaxID=2083498 RepID=UPI000F0EB72B|nr:glycosyltransferase [Ketobacter sp.]RLU01161.1 MAG: glycosyltransferase [Ketobacter sp.]
MRWLTCLKCDSTMKQISLFAPSMRGGGAERVMVALATELSRQGMKVDLVLAKAEGPYLEDVPASVNVVDLNASRIAFALPALNRYLNSTKPDCLLSTLRHANIIAILAKLVSKHRFVLGVREANTIKAHLENDQSTKERILPFLMKCFYNRADVVIAVSNDVKSDLMSCIKMQGDNIVVINNPVVSDAFYELSEASTGHPWLDEKSEPVVLSVGRLTRQKDFASLIRAFSDYRKSHSARLIILGEGEERASLEGLVAELGLTDFVSLPGFVSNPFCFMKQSDVFVLSSLWEGQPNALIQALALGVPVISTDCPGGSRDILKAGKYGTLVPVNSPETLTLALRDVLATKADPVRPRTDTARTYCRLEFGIQPVANQYLNALTGL